MRKSLKLVAATIAVSASSMAIQRADAQVIGDNETSGTWAERSVVDVADSMSKEIAETGKYTIQWGDTLSVIAEAMGLSIDEITVLNQIENPDLIMAGSTLAFDQENHQVTFSNEDTGEAVTYSTETGEEVEPAAVVETEAEYEAEVVVEDGYVLNTVDEWVAPAVEEATDFTYETAEVTYPQDLIVWDETEDVVEEEAVVEEAPVVEEEVTYEEPVVEEVIEEVTYEELAIEEEVAYETELEVSEDTQAWEIVEEETPVVEEPVYEEPAYEEPVYEEPVYEEPVYEEPVVEETPASGSIDYYTASLASMPENANLSEAELAAKLEIRRRESTHNYDVYSQSGNHYGAYQMLDSYFTTYGYGDTSPASQEAAANGYVASRYGSWQAALAHHDANNWY